MRIPGFDEAGRTCWPGTGRLRPRGMTACMPACTMGTTSGGASHASHAATSRPTPDLQSAKQARSDDFSLSGLIRRLQGEMRSLMSAHFQRPELSGV